MKYTDYLNTKKNKQTKQFMIIYVREREKVDCFFVTISCSAIRPVSGAMPGQCQQ